MVDRENHDLFDEQKAQRAFYFRPARLVDNYPQALPSVIFPGAVDFSNPWNRERTRLVQQEIDEVIWVATYNFDAVFQDGASGARQVVHDSLLGSAAHRIDIAKAERDLFILKYFDEPLPTNEELLVTKAAQLLGTSEGQELSAVLKEAGASPKSGLALIHGSPELNSIELASVMHPANWSGPDEAEHLIRQAVCDVFGQSAEIIDDLPDRSKNSTIRIIRHVTPTNDDRGNEVRFVTISKKSLYAKDSESGVCVIKRRGLIVDLEQVRSTDHPERHKEMHAAIEEVLKLLIDMGIEEHKAKPGSAERKKYNKALTFIAEEIDATMLENPLYRQAWMQPIDTSWYAARDSKHALK